MGATVTDMLRLPPLSRGTVIAGSRGLSQEVTSISVLEVADSTVTQFILPDQLVISAFYSIMDNIDEQLAVVRMLKEQGTSGLLLSHVGMFIKEISPQLVALCDALDYPLIYVPPDVPYIDMIRAVLDHLVENKNEQLRLAMQIYDKMTSLILEEQDYVGIISELSRMLGRRQVLLFDYNGQCIANSGRPLPEGLLHYLTSQIGESTADLVVKRRSKSMRALNNGKSYLLVPISSKTSFYGVLVVFSADDLTEQQQIAVNQAKIAISIITMNKINLREFKSRLQDDFTYDLIHWNFPDEKAAHVRARSLGLDLDRVRVVIVLEPFRPHADQDDQEEEIEGRFISAMEDTLQSLGKECLLLHYGGRMVVVSLSDKSEPPQFERLGAILASAAEERMGIPFSVGIGRECVNLPDVEKSYADAVRVIHLSNRIWQTPRCASYDEMPVFLQLAKCVGEEVVSAADKLLEPLMAYDAEHNAELYRTFKMLVVCDWDTSFAAEKLFVHKNTILQRKKKIESLLPGDPFSRIARMQHELAYVLYALLEDQQE